MNADGTQPAAPRRSPPKPRRVRAWLADRLGLEELARTIAGGQVPGGASFWHTLGSVAAGLFMLEAITGILLATVYTPSQFVSWNTPKSTSAPLKNAADHVALIVFAAMSVR